MDLLLASLDTAGEVFLPDVLFCLKCVLAPFVLGCVRACVRACVCAFEWVGLYLHPQPTHLIILP